MENSEMQVLPAGYHIDNAGKLEHEQRCRVERILVGGLEEVDRPHVNVLQVRISTRELMLYSTNDTTSI